MPSIKRYIHLAILRGQHPRIWAPPTHLKKSKKLSPKSAWFTESVSIIWNIKITHRKKLCRFQIPEFNLAILSGVWWLFGRAQQRLVNLSAGWQNKLFLKSAILYNTQLNVTVECWLLIINCKRRTREPIYGIAKKRFMA